MPRPLSGGRRTGSQRRRSTIQSTMAAPMIMATPSGKNVINVFPLPFMRMTFAQGGGNLPPRCVGIQI